MNDLLSLNKLRLSKEDYQKLVAIGLITDGAFIFKACRNTQVIEFYGNDTILHLTFQNLMREGFGRDKTSFYFKLKRKNRDDLYKTGYELSIRDSIVKKLKILSTTYTTKVNSNPQPTINFLLNKKNELKELAVRFAMSCDGCVSVAHTRLKGVIRDKLFRRCLRCGKPTNGALYFYFNIKLNIICRYACEECMQKARNKAKVIEEL